MSRKDIIRAWKDPEYRASLSEAERARLPANPAGLLEAAEDELMAASGGFLYAQAEGTCVCSHHSTCNTCESKCQCTPPDLKSGWGIRF